MPTSSPASIGNQLVLFQFLLQQFGFDKFEKIQAQFADQELKADTADSSIFYQIIADKVRFSSNDLKDYDDHIIQHLNAINAHRSPRINLKYFQYFALLFTEYYLHRYFEDKHDLCEKLNEFKQELCRRQGISRIPDFEADQLNTLAFWMATGSGKTLLLHFNILQYRHYCSDINNLLVLTPSDYLSTQHLEELEKSGIEAIRYLEDRSGDRVKAIDIHKIREFKAGEGVTIGVDELDQRNGVFVDEGHKGSVKEESVWRTMREKMGYRGFTFEYSATFGQISNKDLKNDYSKSIVFDYSYRHFYRDGYGKDYWIHNITENRNITTVVDKRKYLLLNTLLFTQQKLFYAHPAHKTELHDVFLIEDPLLVFVGSTVVNKPSGKTEIEEVEATVTDVEVLVQFFNDLLGNRSQYESWIAEILAGTNTYSSDYASRLHWLTSRFRTPSELYHQMLLSVCHTETPDEIELHTISKAEGEIALKVHNAEDYFALIYIGETSPFKTKFEDQFTFKRDAFSEPLFPSLHDKVKSPINILIGAKKFIEGWNNYRVSSIGLINFGRSEGAQIIQLFGRGVRLRGKEQSLKRTSGEGPGHIGIVETLNIFGLNADYMKKFREDLEREGIKVIRREIQVPAKIISDYGSNLNDLQLVTLTKKENIPAYNTQEIIQLVADTDVKVSLDLSIGRITYRSGSNATDTDVAAVELDIRPFLSFIDFGDLYLKLLAYKRVKGYYNLRIDHDTLTNLLDGISYKITAEQPFRINQYSDIDKLNKIVLTLLKRYTDKFYNAHLRVYEADKLEARTITSDDDAFVGIDYRMEVDITDNEGNELPNIQATLDRIEQVLHDATYPVNMKNNGTLLNAWFENHLFQPLLKDVDHQSIRQITSITPKGLNESEYKFVENLQTHITAARGQGKYTDHEFYLLRNASRGKGFGFYFSAAGGFYPDFMLWIKNSNKQYLTFIDPHGLRNEANGFDSDRIQLHKRIKDLEAREELQGIVLNSIILAPSTFLQSGMDRWTRDQSVSLTEYANSLNVFEIGQNASQGESAYIGMIIDRILA